MPHPFFGAKDVCYIEKKVAKKKAVLGEASLYSHIVMLRLIFVKMMSATVAGGCLSSLAGW